MKVIIIRQAAEGGQLYGSVASRDIAEAITAKGIQVGRSQVVLNDAFKTIGLFPVNVTLHPEVKVAITLNIARSEAEAKTQEKTGKAAIVDYNAREEEPKIDKAALLEESVIAEEEAKEQAIAAENAEDEEKRQKRAAKKAAKAEAEPSEEDAA